MSFFTFFKPVVMPERHYLVPDQFEGTEKDLEYRVFGRDTDDAEDWFVQAKERLWHVNTWEQGCSGINLQFRLTDSHGHILNRRSRKGDHIRITQPGAGAAPQEEHDWVIIEAIEYDDYPDDNLETFAIHMRPAGNPADAVAGKTDGNDNGATSTLVIERNHEILKASYHGRNESASGEASLTEQNDDRSAWLGLSEEQWECLLKGFVGGT